ncbi:lipoprotein [Nakamurella deserti]
MFLFVAPTASLNACGVTGPLGMFSNPTVR